MRCDLTDFEWSVIEPLLPNKTRGMKRVDERRVLNGIFWILRSGALWRALLERYGQILIDTYLAANLCVYGPVGFRFLGRSV